MKKDPKQILLTTIVTIGLLVPAVITLIHSFDIKLDTLDLVNVIAKFVFLILSYGIGAAISGLIFTKLHVGKIIACIGSLALVILCAVILPPIFLAIMNYLFRVLGIIGLVFAFIIAILSTYLSTAGIFLLFVLIFRRGVDFSDKIIGTLWIQETFKDKKGV